MDCTHETTEFRRQRYGTGARLWQKSKQCLICGERISYSDKNPFWPEDFHGETVNLPPYDYMFDTKNEGFEIISDYFEMKEYKCKVCSNNTAFVYVKNGQNIARCLECGAYCYNPSKAEMGQVENKPGRMDVVKRTQRMRILAMDSAKCVICGKTGKDDVLHIAHIISDYDAQCLHKSYPAFKLDYIYDDDNLFTCCSECNLGQGKESLIPKLAVFVSMMIRKRDKKS